LSRVCRYGVWRNAFPELVLGVGERRSELEDRLLRLAFEVDGGEGEIWPELFSNKLVVLWCSCPGRGGAAAPFGRPSR
jgi:hypothetical protein